MEELAYVNAVPSIEVGDSILSLCKILLVGKVIKCGDVITIGEGLSLKICYLKSSSGRTSCIFSDSGANMGGLVVAASTEVDLSGKMCSGNGNEGVFLSEREFVTIATANIIQCDEWTACARAVYKVVSCSGDSSGRSEGLLISTESANGKSLLISTFHSIFRDSNFAHSLYIDCAKPMPASDCQAFVRRLDKYLDSTKNKSSFVAVFIDNIDLISLSNSGYLYLKGFMDYMTNYIRSYSSPTNNYNNSNIASGNGRGAAATDAAGGGRAISKPPALKLIASCSSFSVLPMLQRLDGLLGLSPTCWTHVSIPLPNFCIRLDYFQSIFYSIFDIFRCGESSANNNSRYNSDDPNGEWLRYISRFRGNLLTASNGFSFGDLKALGNSTLLASFAIKNDILSNKHKSSLSSGVEMFEILMENILTFRSRKVLEAIGHIGGSSSSGEDHAGTGSDTSHYNMVGYDESKERMDDIFRDIEQYILRSSGLLASGLEPSSLISSTTTNSSINSLLNNNNINNSSSSAFTDELPCKGVVIYGPSGCGKTSLAYAIADKYKNSFKFIAISCAELVNKVVGESERKLTALFEKARQLSPCIILLDNIDTILGRTNKLTDRQSRTSSVALDRILSTLLVEIDGVMGDSFGGLNDSSSNGNSNSNSNNRGSSSDSRNGAGDTLIIPSISLNRYSKPRPVVVIATTTDISYLDEALLRSGRLEEHLCLDIPDAIQRRQIIDFYILKYFSKFLDDCSKKSPELNTSNSYSRAITTPIVEEIVTLSAGKSGAFIRQIIQEMSMNTIRLYVSEMKTAAGKDADDGSNYSKSRVEGIIDLVVIRKCVEVSFLQVKEKTKLSIDKLSASKLLFKLPK